MTTVVPHQSRLIAFFRRLVKGHKEDFEAIFQNPEVKVHLDEAYTIATVEPHLYEVVFVDTSDNQDALSKVV